MGNQIIRVARYTSGSINSIGREEYRHKYNHKNTSIDEARSHLNITLGNKDRKTLYQLWKTHIEHYGLNYTGKKNQIAMEQIVITASPDFFKQLGWDKIVAREWDKTDIPKEICQYFNDSLKFVKEYIGKENLLSATLHFDEETPHLHVDYIPVICGKRKRKDVYLKDEQGRCIRNERGHAIRAKGSDGKTLYEYVDEPSSINRSQFWAERGGRQSYRQMQDLFHEQVASKHGLERGNRGTDRKHEEQSIYKAKLLRKQIEQKKEAILTLGSLENQTVDELAKILQKSPHVLGRINQSIKIAMGEKTPNQIITVNRERGR